jgi:hypothetical protein
VTAAYKIITALAAGDIDGHRPRSTSPE